MPATILEELNQIQRGCAYLSTTISQYHELKKIYKETHEVCKNSMDVCSYALMLLQKMLILSAPKMPVPMRYEFSTNQNAKVTHDFAMRLIHFVLYMDRALKAEFNIIPQAKLYQPLARKIKVSIEHAEELFAWTVCPYRCLESLLADDKPNVEMTRLPSTVVSSSLPEQPVKRMLLQRGMALVNSSGVVTHAPPAKRSQLALKSTGSLAPAGGVNYEIIPMPHLDQENMIELATQPELVNTAAQELEFQNPNNQLELFQSPIYYLKDMIPPVWSSPTVSVDTGDYEQGFTAWDRMCNKQ